MLCIENHSKKGVPNLDNYITCTYMYEDPKTILKTIIM